MTSPSDKKKPLSPTVEFSIQDLSSNQTELKIDTIRARVDDSTTCAAELEDIEKYNFKPLIERFIFGETTEELKTLVLVLDGLANLLQKLGDLDGKLVHYTDAAIAHQHVLTILEEKLQEESDMRLDPNGRLSELQSKIFARIEADLTKVPDVKAEANSNKAILLKLREDVAKKLNDSILDPEETRELFEDIAQWMRNFLAKIYSDSESQMSSPPPCSYAVIGLGSMALQQITPYSDLEFAILVENEDYREYFENLSHLAHFKVIGLGETAIATSKYGVDTSHLVHVGVNFDLGGKTPLGRIGNDKPYSLIRTVDWMLHYVFNKDDKASHIDKNLPYILENVCFVYGNEELVAEYQTKIAEFLGGENKTDPKNRLNCEIRAIKLLEEGAVEFDYCRPSLDGTHREVAFKGDLDKLKPTLLDNEGISFNVKQEIYRLPDRMVYNFGLLFNVSGSSGWNIIDKLCTEDILSKQAALNLKRALSFATLLRLRAYSHNKAQDEEMSIFPRQVDLKPGILQLSSADLNEESALFQYFFTALVLYDKLNRFCKRGQTLKPEEKRAMFHDSEYLKNDPLSKGLVYFRLAQYADTVHYLEQAAKLTDGQEKHLINLSLGDAYRRLGKWSNAIDCYRYCVKFLERGENSKWRADLTIAYIKLGTAYSDHGQYEEAIKSFELSLVSSDDLDHSDSQILKASTFDSLGLVYQRQGEYDKAELHFNDSLELKKVYFKGQQHLDMTLSMSNLGWLNLFKGDYDKPIEWFKKTWEVQRKFLGNEPHMDVATVLNSLAAVYQKKCQYDQSIIYLQTSLQIQRVIFKGRPHTGLAKSLNLLGWSNSSVGRYHKAKEYFEESLKMERMLNKGAMHPDVASALNNLGSAYQKLGLFDQAAACFQENLELLKAIHLNKDHPDMAASLNNLGMVYYSKAEPEKALLNYTESLRIKKMTYKSDLHPDIATTMNNIGLTLQSMGCHEKAFEYFEASILSLRKVYKDAPHEDLASLLNNLGISYKNLNQLDKALAHHKQSLIIKEQIFYGNPHPSIAATHHNLGTTYQKHGHHFEAIGHYEKALEIQQSNFGDGLHPEAGVTLLNLGNAFCSVGDTDQAILCYEKSLRTQTDDYHSDGHPNILLVLCNLALVLAALGEFSRAIQAIKRAFQQFKKLGQASQQFQKSLTRVVRPFVSCYALNFSRVAWKINNCLFNGQDFTEYSTHLSAIEPGLPEERLIENYKLAAIFTPQDDPVAKSIVFSKLAELTAASHEQINLWLSKVSWSSFDTNTRLTMAIAKCDLNLVSALVKLKANVNEPNNESEKASPLYCALGFFGQPVNLEIIKLLLANGAYVNQAMCDGDTPMHMAHYTGNIEVARLLLTHGGDINVQNYDGKNPLHCLVETKEVGLDVKLQFCEEFAKLYVVQLMDKNGMTGLDFLSERCPEMLEALSNLN